MKNDQTVKPPTQVSLFDAPYLLLNSGISALLSLRADEAEKIFHRYRTTYPRFREPRFEAWSALARHVAAKMPEISDPDPGLPWRCYQVWQSCLNLMETFHFQNGRVLSSLKAALLEKGVDYLRKTGQAESPFLSGGAPAGFFFLEAELPDAALLSLQSAIVADPGNALLYGYLGDAYWMKTEQKAARKCYREACLIDPEKIDWNYLKDEDLTTLLREQREEEGRGRELARQWLPTEAYLRRIFSPKIIRQLDEMKFLTGDFRQKVKEFEKNPSEERGAQIFFLSIVLCDNEPGLRNIEGMDFVQIRRRMKSIHSGFFGRYMDFMKNRSS